MNPFVFGRRQRLSEGTGGNIKEKMGTSHTWYMDLSYFEGGSCCVLKEVGGHLRSPDV